MSAGWLLILFGMYYYTQLHHIFLANSLQQWRLWGLDTQSSSVNSTGTVEASLYKGPVPSFWKLQRKHSACLLASQGTADSTLSTKHNSFIGIQQGYKTMFSYSISSILTDRAHFALNTLPRFLLNTSC